MSLYCIVIVITRQYQFTECINDGFIDMDKNMGLILCNEKGLIDDLLV